MNKDAAYYESRYNPRLAVPEFAQHFARWTENSAKVRKDLSPYLDVPYGSGPLEKLDLFRSKGPSRGLLMFIHGGYWRALDKSQHSFVAAPFVQAGITVATINYALCPAVTVADIVRQVLQAAAWLFRNGGNFGAPEHKLHVAGHSAGGHLTAMVLAKTDARIAAEYDRRLAPEHLRSLGTDLRSRLERVIRAVLAVTGHDELLQENQVLRRSINVRNPYVDPINLVQIELLCRMRSGADEDPRLRDAFVVTVNGIAAGMRNAG